MALEKGSSRWELLLRIIFGSVWIIDGSLKFVTMAPGDVVTLVQMAGTGQPAWLSGWYSFWSGAVSANPTGFLYGVGALELLLGFAVLLGLLRKPAYILGVILALLIYAIDEGFGGPYVFSSSSGIGSTDIGAAIIYTFVFLALWIIDSYLPTHYSLDHVIARKVKWWSKVGFEDRP